MYDYNEQRPKLLTDEGQRKFMEFYQRTMALLDASGAVMMEKLPSVGDSWFSLACADRMMELGFIVEVTLPSVPGQHRVFVKARRW